MNDSNFAYYIYCIIALIVGFVVVKKIASCLIRSVVSGIVLAILIALYYMYMK